MRIQTLEWRDGGEGSVFRIRYLGGSFTVRIREVDREGLRVATEYVEGAHRGAGVWTMERVEGGTRLSYTVDLEPYGFLARLLSNFLDYRRLHSAGMREIFRNLESYLRS